MVPIKFSAANEALGSNEPTNEGTENLYVVARHGSKGPELVPEMHVLVWPHHPHALLCKQSFLLT